MSADNRHYYHIQVLCFKLPEIALQYFFSKNIVCKALKRQEKQKERINNYFNRYKNEQGTK